MEGRYTIRNKGGEWTTTRCSSLKERKWKTGGRRGELYEWKPRPSNDERERVAKEECV
jgi:hypothetical protein